MAVVPLFLEQDLGGPEYLTLKQALDDQLLVVTEVSEGGSVPDVRVENKADLPVLLLDGEELAGAKQNRVLNTSILLKEHSTTVIPVSCTEQGRWRYSSKAFADSGTVLAATIRSSKSSSVSASLKRRAGYRSDQSGVWRSIAGLSSRARVTSPSGALRDVYEARRKELDEYIEAFEVSDKQVGLLVFVAGKISGFDILSRPEAFAKLAPKLFKSYALEASLKESGDTWKTSVEEAEEFLETAAEAPHTTHDSVGYGTDYRFSTEELVGSALVVDDTVIHTAFFPSTPADRTGPMADLQQRRRFRN
jgi:hypothetical protein